MKICKKCGCHNSDDRNFCLDCDEPLGAPISGEDEKKLNDKMTEFYNRQDPLYVSKSDKIMGILSAFGALISLLFILFKLNWDLSISALVMFLISVIEAVFPKIPWTLETLRLTFLIDGDVEPNDFYFKSRKIAIISAFVIGTIMLVIILVNR